MRADINGRSIKVYNVKPSAIGAEDRGAAAAARTDAIAYVNQRVQEINGSYPTPEQIGAIPQSARGQAWGVADLGADGKLWQGHRPPHPSPADIGAIPQSARGQPWGVADLGADGKLWQGHRPPHPSPADIGAINQNDRGQAWGVAELNADRKVRSEQLPDFQKLIDPLYPVSAFILWGFGRVLVGSPFGPGTLSTNSQLNRYSTQSPAAAGDEAEVTFLLKNGFYRLEVWGMRNSQQGIFQLFVNDQQIGGDIDRYASAAGPVAHSFNLNLSETKVNKLRTKVIGKNASSVGFQLWISAVVLYQIP